MEKASLVKFIWITSCIVVFIVFMLVKSLPWQLAFILFVPSIFVRLYLKSLKSNQSIKIVK